jgi:uncharacterized membrane protein YvlD (DUF360 family)|tara:strand:+ start:230 stop:412 length:183 start_codon:yes stop_codon:yes gene_type:complete
MLNLGFSALFSLIVTLSVFEITLSLQNKISELTFLTLIMATIILSLFSLLLLWQLTQSRN